MSYNRWMPRQYYSGGELYHYGRKGMKWGKHIFGDFKLPDIRWTFTRRT